MTLYLRHTQVGEEWAVVEICFGTRKAGLRALLRADEWEALQRAMPDVPVQGESQQTERGKACFTKCQ